MTVTVEMSAEEFTEFLTFRKTKTVQNEKLNSALTSVRAKMNELSEALLEAVNYDFMKPEKLCVKNKEAFNNAVKLANDWFC